VVDKEGNVLLDEPDDGTGGRLGNTMADERVIATKIVVCENAPHPCCNIGGTIARIHKVADDCIQRAGGWVWSHDVNLGSWPIQNLILGVGGRNAANGQFARARGLDTSDFLEAVATA
jgi:hypothetical protein